MKFNFEIVRLQQQLHERRQAVRAQAQSLVQDCKSKMVSRPILLGSVGLGLMLGYLLLLTRSPKGQDCATSGTAEPARSRTRRLLVMDMLALTRVVVSLLAAARFNVR